MTDPWHAETLDQLVVFLRSLAPVRWAVVTATSPVLEREVVTELRERLQDSLWHDLALSGANDLETFVAWRLQPPDPRRVVLVTGLNEITKAQTGTMVEVLGAFNLQREGLAERGEGLVLLTDETAAAELMRQAPDFYRFTIGFGFERIEDWIEQGRAEETREVYEPIGEFSDEVYERRLEAARAVESSRSLMMALLDLADRKNRQERVTEAEDYTQEALSISGQLADPELYIRALEARARFLSMRGRANEAVDFARAAYYSAIERGVSDYISHRAHWTFADALDRTGRHKEALAVVEQALSAESRLNPSWKAAMVHTRANILSILGRFVDAIDTLRTDVPQPIPNHLRGDHFDTWRGIYEGIGDLLNAARAAGRAYAHYSEALIWFAYKTAKLLWKHGQINHARKSLQSASMDPATNLVQPAGLSWLRMAIEIDLEADDELLSQQVNACLEICWKAEHRPWISVATLLVAGVHALAGRFPEALDRGEEARIMVEEMSYSRFLPDCEHTLARFHRLAGHLEKAITLAEQAAHRAHVQGNRPAIARADTERAFIAIARGDAKTARTHAETALQCIGETRFRIDEPAALAALAAARRLAGNDDSSDERRWRRLVRGMGARGLERRIEQSLAATGLPLPPASDDG